MMRESGNYRPSGGFMDESRSRYNDGPNSRGNFIGNQRNYDAFPPPGNNSGGSNNYGDSSMDNHWYGNNLTSGNGMGMQRSSMTGPSMGSGDMDGGMCPPSGMMGGMRNSGFSNSSKDQGFISSIQSMSHQMSSQQTDIATKIISAVLSTNLMGNLSNQQQSSYNEDEMGEYDSHRSGRSYRHRKSPMRVRRSRISSDRYSQEMRARSPRPNRRFSDSRRPEVRGRPSVRGWLAYKRPRRSTSRDGESESRFKRRRRESQNKSAIRYRSIKKESETTKRDEESEKKELEPTPHEALYCHMCKHGNFTSEQTYLCHLEGIRHTKTSRAFHSKNEATLEYLRRNAKLANIRFGSLDRSIEPSRCSICSTIVTESFFKHKKLLEHKVVKKFLKPQCCGKYFATRYHMDEHRLSLPHLKEFHLENTKRQLLMAECIKGESVKWSFEDAVKYLKSKNPMIEEDLSLDNIPPFDGNTFIGVNFLLPRDALLCRPCEQLVPIGVKSLEGHMLSLDHYNKVLDYLREKRRCERMNRSEDDVVGSGGQESSLWEVGEDIGPNKRPTGRDHDDSDVSSDDDAAPEQIQIPTDDEIDLSLEDGAHIVLEELDGEDKEPPEEANEEEEEQESGEKEGSDSVRIIGEDLGEETQIYEGDNDQDIFVE